MYKTRQTKLIHQPIGLTLILELWRIMDTCARCGKKLGFFERRTSSLMFKNALHNGLFSEFMDKKTCLACKHELLDSQGIKYRGRMGKRQGLARIKELASKQNMNPITNQGTKKIISRKLIISSFVYVFGGLFLLLGIYTYVYYETNWIGWIGIAFYPYQNYAILMLIAGIALMITGFVTQERARAYRKGVEKQQPIANLGVCSNCGAIRDLDEQYCKKCGKKFE